MVFALLSVPVVAYVVWEAADTVNPLWGELRASLASVVWLLLWAVLEVVR